MSVAPSAVAFAVLTWDTGDRQAVYGRTVFGRNPLGAADVLAVAVRDETLSLSRTHFEIGGDATGAWLADHTSRNGTVIVRGSVRRTVEPGERVRLQVGDRIELGDRVVVVNGAP
jgi:pSer/pThr/pTyr-binding forkhead associated (FHA) protein